MSAVPVRTVIPMIVAPLCLALGSVLDSTGEPTDVGFLAQVHTDRTAYALSTVLLAFGLALMPFAAAGARQLASGRGATLLRIGWVLTAIGGVAGCASAWMFGVGHLVASDPSLDPAAMHQFTTNVTNSPVAVVPTAAGFLLTALGTALIGIGVWRNRRYGAMGIAAAILLCLFCIGSVVIDASGPASLPRDLPLVLGYGLLATMAMRRTADVAAEPDQTPVTV